MTGSVGWDLRKVNLLSSSVRRWRLTFRARRGLAVGAARVGVGGRDRKVSIQELCLSLVMSKKPLNSKVIKSFEPELRSCKCFLSFGIPMLSIYGLWTLCTFHIFMYGYFYSDFQVLQSLLQACGDRSKCSNFNWYRCDFHFLRFLQLTGKILVSKISYS